MKRVVLLASLVFASTASAEPGFGIAVINPVMWRDQESIGGSFYYRFQPKQFIRINVAHYRHAGTPMQHALDVVRGGVRLHTGRASDISAGWLYFPQRAFDGPTIELGVVFRDDEQKHDDLWTHTHGQAARALVGWSWLYRERWFASVAAGGSAGHARGTDYNQHMDDEVSTWTADFEGYVRLGLVFGN